MIAPMKAREPVNRYMTVDVRSIEVTAPASQLLRLFDESPFHHLPVVKGGILVGMLSTSDVNKLRAFLPRHVTDTDAYLDAHVQIDRLMRWPAITVGGTQSLEQAVALMNEHGVHALPVTDAAGRLAGILTTTDLLKAALHPERRDEEPAGDEAGGLRRELQQLRSRMQALEQVVDCAERYVRAGQDERLHSMLLKALDRVRGTSGANSTPVLL
jgi:acetoin utilization protein AcuB